MTAVIKLKEQIEGLSFKKHGYIDAEKQLIAFADAYASLSPEEAKALRGKFDEKERLRLFQAASSLFKKVFPDAEDRKKSTLCKILFATYSFDNLGFGYDSFLTLDGIIPLLQNNAQTARKSWSSFEALTSDSRAKIKIEKILYP